MCDRDALVEIYRTSTGRKWTNTTNWDSDERYGLWYGVKVDVAGHVLRLGLNNNNLEGVLPKDPIMKYLKNIVCLDLSSNYLSGGIPEWIGNLACLEELNLSWNQLNGAIPDILFNLVELKLLRLDSNHLIGEVSECIGNLRNIRHINLSKNQLSGHIPQVSSRLPLLQVIDFSRNQFVGDIPTTVKEFREMRPKEQRNEKETI